MGNIGRCSKDLAAESMVLFMDSLPTADSNLESQILTEIDGKQLNQINNIMKRALVK